MKSDDWMGKMKKTQSRITAYSKNCLTPKVEDFTIFLYRGISELLCINNLHETLILPLPKRKWVLYLPHYFSSQTDCTKKSHPDQVEDCALTRDPWLSIGGINWTTDSLGKNSEEWPGQTFVKEWIVAAILLCSANWCHILPRYIAKPHFPVLL